VFTNYTPRDLGSARARAEAVLLFSHRGSTSPEDIDIAANVVANSVNKIGPSDAVLMKFGPGHIPRLEAGDAPSRRADNHSILHPTPIEFPL
jgi:hypothetical protein